MEVSFALKLYPCATGGKQASSPFPKHWLSSLKNIFLLPLYTEQGPEEDSVACWEVPGSAAISGLFLGLKLSGLTSQSCSPLGNWGIEIEHNCKIYHFQPSRKEKMESDMLSLAVCLPPWNVKYRYHSPSCYNPQCKTWGHHDLST